MVGFEKAANNNGIKNGSFQLVSVNNTNSLHHRQLSSTSVAINLDHGDPTMFEPYWRKLGAKCTVVISGSDLMSYFSDPGNVCWFLEPDLGDAINNIHLEVGNAAWTDRHIVVGTGSTQLYQAALFALSSSDGPGPIDVVSAAPFYSAFPEETDYLRSGLYKWAGDAYKYEKDGAYIEVVNSPNNPDGTTRDAVVEGGKGKGKGKGKLIHDLAYYWPQYTPITKPADHDIMLFTFSKCTGHAGTRIGWALVKDKEVAKRMVKFMEHSSIGVSKESQLRAAKILRTICESYISFWPNKSDDFFEYAQRLMAERWKRLREVVKRSEIFSLPEYPQEYCTYTGRFTAPHPAFAWLKSKGESDCEKLLRANKIMVRGGKRFGAEAMYARVSMLSKDEVFDTFLERLSAIKKLD